MGDEKTKPSQKPGMTIAHGSKVDPKLTKELADLMSGIFPDEEVKIEQLPDVPDDKAKG